MIHITKRAQDYLKILILKQNKKSNLRITIANPGTEYAECKISYDTQQIKLDEDIELQYDGFSIYIMKNISYYLHDAKIDLIGDQMNQKLMLLAPHAVNQNLSQSSNDNLKNNHSLLVQVRDFIDLHINPMLNMHGGKIILVNFSETGYALIKFLGGCNGCTMSNITLKKGIEKKILHRFPIINGVQDITQHARGVHSFF